MCVGIGIVYDLSCVVVRLGESTSTASTLSIRSHRFDEAKSRVDGNQVSSPVSPFYTAAPIQLEDDIPQFKLACNSFFDICPVLTHFICYFLYRDDPTSKAKDSLDRNPGLGSVTKIHNKKLLLCNGFICECSRLLII